MELESAVSQQRGVLYSMWSEQSAFHESFPSSRKLTWRGSLASLGSRKPDSLVRGNSNLQHVMTRCEMLFVRFVLYFILPLPQMPPSLDIAHCPLYGMHVFRHYLKHMVEGSDLASHTLLQELASKRHECGITISPQASLMEVIDDCEVVCRYGNHMLRVTS